MMGTLGKVGTDGGIREFVWHVIMALAYPCAFLVAWKLVVASPYKHHRPASSPTPASSRKLCVFYRAGIPLGPPAGAFISTVATMVSNLLLIPWCKVS
jgi:hypothetical protein